MTDLSEFLLERIAEDESSARDLADFDGIGEWAFERHERDLVWMVSSPAGVQIITGYVGNGDSRPAAEHIARWDPARVLAECQAKRTIVRLWNETEEGTYGDQGPSVAAEAAYALAAVYADHPDYDQAWRP